MCQVGYNKLFIIMAHNVENFKYSLLTYKSLQNIKIYYQTFNISIDLWGTK